jgi:hypothetical protein
LSWAIKGRKAGLSAPKLGAFAVLSAVRKPEFIGGSFAERHVAPKDMSTRLLRFRRLSGASLRRHQNMFQKMTPPARAIQAWLGSRYRTRLASLRASMTQTWRKHDASMTQTCAKSGPARYGEAAALVPSRSCGSLAGGGLPVVSQLFDAQKYGSRPKSSSFDAFVKGSFCRQAQNWARLEPLCAQRRQLGLATAFRQPSPLPAATSASSSNSRAGGGEPRRIKRPAAQADLNEPGRRFRAPAAARPAQADDF